MLHPKYRADIDGLRAVAVLGVVAFHAFPGRLPGGYIGVDIFFVISGFLISTIIIQNLQARQFEFREFYARRILRIFPALIVVLFGVLILGLTTLISEELQQLNKGIFAGAFFFTNIMLQNDSGYFHDSSETNPLLHLWSLAIEEQFYLIWPLILVTAWKRKLNTTFVMLTLIIFSFYINISNYDKNAIVNFYSPLSRFWELLLGGLLAVKMNSNNDSDVASTLSGNRIRMLFRNFYLSNSDTLKNFTSLFGITLITFGFFALDKNDSYPGYWVLLPVVGSLLLISSGRGAWINVNLLSHRILVWFGLISYPLYLWHWPLISFSWIVEGDAPSVSIRVLLILFATLLAWLTMKFIEKPFRLRKKLIREKITFLTLIIILLGLSGQFLASSTLLNGRGFENLAIERKGKEYAFGSSLKWYEGKENWLFLGNNYDNSVAKLKLSMIPNNEEVNATTGLFSYLANASARYSTRLVLIVGPNKESVYPEFLPTGLDPSAERYSNFFIRPLSKIPNLTLHDPTSDLIRSKESSGLLYWRTDTHWNLKGAYLSYSGFLDKFSITKPNLDFQKGEVHKGDLIDLGGIEQFPLQSGDDWKPVWKIQPQWSKQKFPEIQKIVSTEKEFIINRIPLSNQYIWVIGDSFSDAMRQYFNATFKKVLYLGHWAENLEALPQNLGRVTNKPDMVVIVRVERSF